MLNIPLASLSAGRGTSPGYTVSLNYNGKIWDGKQQYKFNGSPDPVHGNIFYTKQLLVQADDGGWHLNAGGYELSVINKFDTDAANMCYAANAATYAKNGYTYKVQMKMPSGGVVTFRPYGSGPAYGDPFEHDFFSIDPTGLRHLYVEDVGINMQPTCGYYPNQEVSTGMNYYSSDGSGLRLFIPAGAAGVANWRLYLPDGSLVESNPGDDTSVFQRITDRNGNSVVWKGETINGLPGIKIQNDAGKYIFISTGESYANTIITPGFNGELLETTVHWKDYYVYRKYKATSAFNAPTFERYEERPWEFLNVDKITLPAQAGGLEYDFTYNALDTEPSGYTEGWGDLKTITLPSRAKAEYDYALELGTFVPTSNQMVLDLGVLGRTLTYHTQYDGNPQLITEKTKYAQDLRVTPDGGRHFESGSWSADFYGYNCRIVNPDGSVSEKLWAKNEAPMVGGYAVNAYVKTEYISIPDANGNPVQTAIKDYDYDKNGNTLEIREYDWVDYNSIPRVGSGITLRPTGLPSGLTLKRKTVNTYYYPTPIATDTTTFSANNYANPGSPRLHNVIKSTEIRDGGGTVKARSEFSYDDPSTKGNLIETRVWDNTRGALSTPDGNGNRLDTNNSISTRTEYDPYGNPTLTTDANGNQTLITYDAVSGPDGEVPDLYPTQIKTAYGKAIERTVSSTYDFYTGLVTSITDEDNSLTNATEYDALGRPTKTITAQGTQLESWITTEYNAAARRIIVRSDLETKGDGKKVATQFYDELGRVRLSKTLEDAATQSAANETDGIKVQTRYGYDNPTDPENSNGTYSLTSNPYRAANSGDASGEETMGWTQSYSTRTGRHGETTTFSGVGLPAPWGSNSTSTGVAQADTTANITLTTDQAGKQKRSITDVFGRLTRLDECDNLGTLGSVDSPNQPTFYSYDLTGNLTQVVQGDQTRTFQYSSLGRLLAAINPESGTIQYAYDLNGNLKQKTDARSVTISYSYDALNRLSQRSYASEPSTQPATPAVIYTYDNLPHAKGKLTKVSSTISTTESLAFDILGHVTASRQTTDGRQYDVAYGYNLSGALTDEIYPGGRVVKNVLDNAGNLGIVQSKKNVSAGFWHYADSIMYNAPGAVTSLQLGNGHFESTRFNSRLEPVQIALGTSQNSSDLLKINYNYGTTQNNGNVLSQQITVPASGSSPGFTAMQAYTYDSLNRIKDATETIAGGQSWKQAFVYDRYGNRNFDEAATTTLLKKCGDERTEIVCENDRKAENPALNGDNNRLAAGQGYAYDSAGNVRTDVTSNTYIFDGENKQIEVRDSQSNLIGQYFYDGDGKRIKKVSAAETVIFVYDASGKTVAEYSTAISETPQVAYLTSDALGTPRINTSAGGAVIARHDYHPFGDEISTPERTPESGYDFDQIRKKFAGYERDDETGLDFAQARMYSASLGRFTAVDPLIQSAKVSLPQSWNRYAYCMNLPLTLIDPDGEKWKFENRELRNAFEEAVKAKGKEAWQAYQAVSKAKGVVTVGFGELKQNRAGLTKITGISHNGVLTNVKGSITISNDPGQLDKSNLTDVISVSSHEFNHVLSKLVGLKVNGVAGLAPERDAPPDKADFDMEKAAFEDQLNAVDIAIRSGGKIPSGRAADRSAAYFRAAKTDAEKYDVLSSFGYDFYEKRPSPVPATPQTSKKKKD